MGTDLVPWRRPPIPFGADPDPILASIPEDIHASTMELVRRLEPGQEVRWSKAGDPYVFDPAPRPAAGTPEGGNGVRPSFEEDAHRAYALNRAKLYAALKEQAFATVYKEQAAQLAPLLLEVQQRVLLEGLAPDATDKDKDRAARTTEKLLDRLGGRAVQQVDSGPGAEQSWVMKFARGAKADDE